MTRVLHCERISSQPRPADQPAAACRPISQPRLASRSARPAGQPAGRSASHGRPATCRICIHRPAGRGWLGRMIKSVSLLPPPAVAGRQVSHRPISQPWPADRSAASRPADGRPAGQPAVWPASQPDGRPAGGRGRPASQPAEDIILAIKQPPPGKNSSFNRSKFILSRFGRFRMLPADQQTLQVLAFLIPFNVVFLLIAGHSGTFQDVFEIVPELGGLFEHSLDHRRNTHTSG